MARPTKKTQEILDKLGEALKLGLSRRQASHFAGISYDTLKRWCKDDEEFCTHLNAREAEGVVRHAKYLNAHVVDDDRYVRLDPACVAASKFYLSTRKEDPWTTKESVEHTGTVSFTEAIANMEKGIKEDDE